MVSRARIALALFCAHTAAVLLVIPCRASLGAAAPLLSETAEYYTEHNRFSDALGLWRRVLEREPENTQAVYRASELALLLEGRSSARDLVVAFIRARSRQVPYSLMRPTIRHLSQLQSKFLTDEGNSLYLRGKHRMKLGDSLGAVSAYTASLEREPGNLATWLALAEAYKRAGNVDAYLNSLRKANDAHPYRLDVIEPLVELEVAQGNEQAANRVLLELFPGTKTPRIALATAVREYKLGSYKKALRLLGSIKASASLQAEVSWFSSQIYRALELDDAAKREQENFMRYASKPSSLHWDPYGLQEQVKELKRAQDLPTKSEKPSDASAESS